MNFNDNRYRISWAHKEGGENERKKLISSSILIEFHLFLFGARVRREKYFPKKKKPVDAYLDLN